MFYLYAEQPQSKMELHKYPFIRLLIPYMLAIWLYERFVHQELTVFAHLLFLFSLGLFIFNFYLNKSYRFRWVAGFLLSLIFFALGWVNTGLRQPFANQKHLIHDTTQYPFYYARITEPPVEREKSVKTNAELIAVFDGEKLLAKRGSMMVYFAVDSGLIIPTYGQLIRLEKAPSEIEKAKNPNQFDYRKYLARKGVYYQVYLKANEYTPMQMSWRNPLFRFAFSLRDIFLKKMQLHHVEGDAFGVAAAILLGYDESLPAYLRQGYTAAGAMHVLCVSGLHVGIVFMFFNFLLSLVFRKSAPGLKIMLLLLLIWFYALLTGLAPSVQRSAIMLSFVLIAQLFRRKGYVLNSIAASAFFILLFEPYVLFNLGFQLSYLAVIGIVLFQRPIYGLLYFKQKLPDKIWELSSVSLAAQLTTTPLVLHYFNQFPAYFLLGNLVLVPISFVVIVSGMSFLALSFVPIVADLAGWVTSGLIWVMNKSVGFIENLPGSVLKGLFISWWEALLVMLLVGFLYLILTRRKRIFALASLASMVLLFSSFAWRSYASNRQSALIVYSLNKHIAIQLIDGKKHVIIADSTLKDDAFQLGFHLEKNFVVRGLSPQAVWVDLDSSVQTGNWFKLGPFIRTARHSLVLWNKQADENCKLADSMPKADLLLVAGRIKTKPEVLIQHLQPNCIILDASVPAKQLAQWLEKCAETGTRCHNIRSQGAFIVED